MIFRNPQFFGLLIILVPFVIAIIFSGRPRWDACRPSGAVNYSDITDLKQSKSTWKIRGAKIIPWLTIISLFLIIMGLTRPQLGIRQSMLRRAGIDIILALDVSPSMLTEDFKIKGRPVTRLEVVKTVARDFINKRPNDRIGMVIFAGNSYILSPLTWDHQWCLGRLGELQAGMADEGTAIGSGLATAVNRLHDSKAKSKVVILLTDGINNAGQVTPEAAAKAAKALSIIVYTIGAGSKGTALTPAVDQTNNNARLDPDESLLTGIAQETGGRYFPAADTPSLAAVFERINRMEKTALNAPNYQEYQDLYPELLLVAVILLFSETLLANTVFRRLP